MPNPTYNPKKKKTNLWKVLVFQFILAFLVLVMIKLTPESIGKDWSWWIITAPIWLPVIAFVSLDLLLWLVFVLNEYFKNYNDPYGKD